MAGELDLRPLLEALHARGCVCALPVVVGAPRARSCSARGSRASALVTSRFGIAEPAPDRPAVRPQHVARPAAGVRRRRLPPRLRRRLLRSHARHAASRRRRAVCRPSASASRCSAARRCRASRSTSGSTAARHRGRRPPLLTPVHRHGDVSTIGSRAVHRAHVPLRLPPGPARALFPALAAAPQPAAARVAASCSTRAAAAPSPG